MPRLNSLSPTKIQNTFFLNGIASIIGWNSVLSSLDYFGTIYHTHNVYLCFPIPVFIGYFVSALLFYWMSDKYAVQKLIKLGIIFTNVALALLFGVSVMCIRGYVGIQIGFYCTLFVCFLLGFFNNTAQLSFYALINYFGSTIISRFTIGTAVSGLALIILRATITFLLENNTASTINYIPILIYFSLAITFNIFDLYCNLKMFSLQEFIVCTKNQQQLKLIKKASISSKTVLTKKQSLKLQQVQNNKSWEQTSKSNVSQTNYISYLWQAFKQTNPYPLVIFFNLLITFTLFPNLTLAKQTNLGPIWTGIMFILVFNLGDFVGKLTGGFRNWFNGTSTVYLLICRIFFYYTITLMLKKYTQQDHILNSIVFIFLNQFLFSFTNGFVLNAGFILAYEKCPVQIRKYSGVLCGIVLEAGLVIGTFLAIPIQNFVQSDGLGV